jgi:hypothetical protein
MSQWPSSKARRVLAALLRLDGDELGLRMLARLSKQTGLTPDDL